MAATSQPKAEGPIKVGVTLSRLTAITKNPSGKLWGYKGQTRVVIDLTAPDVKLYPVIEPGTQDDAELKSQLETVYEDAYGDRRGRRGGVEAAGCAGGE